MRKLLTLIATTIGLLLAGAATGEAQSVIRVDEKIAHTLLKPGRAVSVRGSHILDLLNSALLRVPLREELGELEISRHKPAVRCHFELATVLSGDCRGDREGVMSVARDEGQHTLAARPKI